MDHATANEVEADLRKQPARAKGRECKKLFTLSRQMKNFRDNFRSAMSEKI
jgi:hypothetical protein